MSDDRPHPKGDEWFKRPLTDAEADRLLDVVHGGGGGGGSSRQGCLLVLATIAVSLTAIIGAIVAIAPT